MSQIPWTTESLPKHSTNAKYENPLNKTVIVRNIPSSGTQIGRALEFEITTRGTFRFFFFIT